MKKRIAYKTVKRKLIFTLVSLFIFFLGFICPVSAQWNFIPQITVSGPCSSGSAQAEIAAANATISSLFTGLGLPTQSLCESIRQQVLATRVSSPEYDTNGKYIGECSVFYTCTPCTGSDIPGQGSTSGPVSIPGQVNPGDISINGILEGKSIFTSHQSSAFEDWASEYKQLLANYGINSILGANFKFPRTPLTDDKAFNILYITLSGNFRPMIKPVLTPRIVTAPTPKIAPAPAPKTELPSISIPVMGGSPLTQAERERQNLNKQREMDDLNKQIGHNIGYDQYAWNTATNGNINENSTSGESFSDKLLDYGKDATESSYSKWVGNIADVVCSNASAAAKILGSEDQATLSSQMEMQFDSRMVIFKASVITIADKITDTGVGFITGKAIGAIEYIGEKTCIRLSPNVSPDVVKMNYNDGLALGKAILEKSETVKKYWGINSKK